MQVHAALRHNRNPFRRGVGEGSSFHASYSVIESPDIHYGRKNADFGQGFYTSDKYEFAGRWVTPRPDADIIINKYELDEKNLEIKRFDRDKEWFEYIFNNRRSMSEFAKTMESLKFLPKTEPNNCRLL